MSIEVLTVSSKGQVVLPAKMRKKLAIENGSRLAAYSTGDMIMLKPISIPTEQDFAASLDEAEAWAKQAGYEESDVNEIIKSARRKKRS